LVDHNNFQKAARFVFWFFGFVVFLFIFLWGDFLFSFYVANSICPSILGTDVALWESWIVTFLRIQQLKAINHYIPIDQPRLGVCFAFALCCVVM
jgi:hypothetical protein